MPKGKPNFVLSGVMLAVMDLITVKAHKMGGRH